ncbi:MAG: RidA family protein [Thermodesulfobacteriota bacterium]|jgi:enamine deaminase RidA (YjgF/YER057c/UK114 family)
MEKKFIHPEQLANFPKFFTQVVTVKSGETKTIYISGQVAIDREGKVVGKGDLGAQAAQVFENLSFALESAGGKPEDVVKLNMYVVNMKPEDGKTVGLARRKWFNQENLPASTMVGVVSLAGPDFLLEVEAIAVIG